MVCYGWTGVSNSECCIIIPAANTHVPLLISEEIAPSLLFLLSRWAHLQVFLMLLLLHDDQPAQGTLSEGPWGSPHSDQDACRQPVCFQSPETTPGVWANIRNQRIWWQVVLFRCHLHSFGTLLFRHFPRGLLCQHKRPVRIYRSNEIETSFVFLVERVHISCFKMSSKPLQ